MKKLLIVIGVVASLVYYCTYDEGYHINDWMWHEKEKHVIGWKQTKTVDIGNGLFRVEYPDIFVPDSSDNIHSRLLLVDTIGKGLEMIAYSLRNSEKWDTETAAELIAMARSEKNGDSIMMRDMHEGYFYLKGETMEGDYRFYEQYVVDTERICILALRYPTLIEEKMERLFHLVHEWHPEYETLGSFFGKPIVLNKTVYDQIAAIARKDRMLSYGDSVLWIGKVGWRINYHEGKNSIMLMTSVEPDASQMQPVIRYLKRFYGMPNEEDEAFDIKWSSSNDPNDVFKPGSTRVHFRRVHSDEGGTMIVFE